MRGGRLVQLVLALFVCLIVAPPIQAQAPEPIRIGVDGIMTGPNADNGFYTSSGAQLAVDEINAAGGIQVPGSGKRPLKLFVEDDQGKPDAGVNAIKKLVSDDKVIAFLGPDYSGITLASLFIGKESQTPQITSSISSSITKQGNPYLFRGRTDDEAWMKSQLDYLAKDLGQKKIAISYTNIELGKNGAEVAQKYLKEPYGLTPVLVVSHQAGDKDFSASATKIAQANPDVLINWGLQNEAALLLSALRNMGWKGTFVFQAADDIFLKQAGKLAVGVVGPQNWAYTKSDDRSKKFVAAFKAKFNKNPSPHSVIYYDGVYIIKDAIEHVGVDKQKIRDYIAAIKNYQGVEGKYHPADLERGGMSTAVVIIKYDDNLVPQVIKEFQ